MGRSVDYAKNSIKVLYFAPQITQYVINEETEEETDEIDEFLTQMNWDDFVDNIKAELQSKFNLNEVKNKWESNEVKTILEGNGVLVHLSEYMGLVSLSFTADETSLEYVETIEEYDIKLFRIIEQINNIVDFINTNEIFGYYNPLNKVGTFSNGEGVFTKK